MIGAGGFGILNGIQELRDADPTPIPRSPKKRKKTKPARDDDYDDGDRPRRGRDDYDDDRPRRPRDDYDDRPRRPRDD